LPCVDRCGGQWPSVCKVHCRHCVVVSGDAVLGGTQSTRRALCGRPYKPSCRSEPNRTLKLAALSLRVAHVGTLWYISTVRLTKSDSRGNARDQSTSSTAARNLGAFIAALDAPRLQERTGASHQLSQSISSPGRNLGHESANEAAWLPPRYLQPICLHRPPCGRTAAQCHSHRHTGQDHPLVVRARSDCLRLDIVAPCGAPCGMGSTSGLRLKKQGDGAAEDPTGLRA
jgi:hypothetical protein